MPSQDHLGRRFYEWCRPKSLADALQITGAVVATVWFVVTTDFGQWRPILPLLAVAFFCFVLWGISLVRQLLYSDGPAADGSDRTATRSDVSAVTQPPQERRQPCVEFWLPSNWQPGFRHKTLPIDETVGEVFAEEVILQIIAKRRMQNVRLEISTKHRRGNNQLEILARVGSDVFTGVVQKDQEQSFVIVHRTFWNARGVYQDPAKGGKDSAPVRVEKGVTFFPENPKATFRGELGDKYTFQVTLLHDEGPENAYFSITLEPWQIFPLSRITSMDNIKPITRN